MALVNVGLTLVTHVAADAEDTSAVLRLPTVSAARSVWFEADANSANRTAGRRGIIVCFCLDIRPPWTCPEYCRNCLAAPCQNAFAFGRIFGAVVRVQQSRSKIRWSLGRDGGTSAGEPRFQIFWGENRKWCGRDSLHRSRRRSMVDGRMVATVRTGGALGAELGTVQAHVTPQFSQGGATRHR